MDRFEDEIIIYEYKGKGVLESSINIKDYLLKIITERGPISRHGLNQITRIPLTTLYDVLVKLIINNQITKFSEFTRKRGRPRILYKVKRM